tara:strand:- start:348 stop:1007 length:660 start_codon:yes stop_codon:yes gene_type:complete
MVRAKVKTEKKFFCAECNKPFAGASGLWYHNKHTHGVETNTRKKRKKTVQMKYKPKKTLKKKDSIERVNIPNRIISPKNVGDIEFIDEDFNKVLELLAQDNWFGDYDGPIIGRDGNFDGPIERIKSFDELYVPVPCETDTNVPKKLDTNKRKRDANISGGNSGKKPKEYSKEKRRKIIDKWLGRRKNRNWSKSKTKYKHRQDFSKTRPRVNGRFIKINK